MNKEQELAVCDGSSYRSYQMNGVLNRTQGQLGRLKITPEIVPTITMLKNNKPIMMSVFAFRFFTLSQAIASASLAILYR